MLSARLLRAVLTVVLVSGVGVIVDAAPASATVTRLCSGYTACAKAGMSSSGYAAAAGTMWWRMYSGHNCTNYAAYRMVQSGLSTERPWSGSGNATNWGAAMRDITDHTPAVGAVAWWSAYVSPAGSAGHVAYVEKVISPDEIIVSQDSWGGDFSWARITRESKGWPSGFVHFNDVPLTNTARPAVTGAARVGSVLTGSSGEWQPRNVDVEYQWRADRVDIPGAQSSTLTVTKALEGKRIKVEVTASRLGYPTTSATSRRTRAVQPGVLTSTAPPTVVGEATVDSTLTVDAGTWDPAPDGVSYQWLADGQPLAGSTGPDLAVTPALVGRTIAVTVTATRRGYETVSVTSAATPAVSTGTLTVPDPPTLSGVPRSGETLTLTLPEASPAAAPSVRWLRGGVPVDGASGTTYTLTDADLGSRVSASVRYDRDGYTTATTRSARTPVVRATPRVRIGTEAGVGSLDVRAAVRAGGVTPVEGIVQIRSRGQLLEEVVLADGRATATVTGLPAGTWTFRFRYSGTRKVAGETVRKSIRIG